MSGSEEPTVRAEDASTQLADVATVAGASLRVGALSSRISLPVLFALGAALCVVLALFDVGPWLGRVPRGVSLGPHALSGADAATVDAAVERVATSLTQRELPVRVGRRLRRVSAVTLGLHVDRPATLARVRAHSGVFAPLLRAVLGPLTLEPALAVDEARARATLARLEAELIEARAFDGALEEHDGKVVAKAPKAGQRLDAPAALTALRALADGSADALVELPVVTAEPRLGPAAVEAARLAAERLVAGPVTLVHAGRDLSLKIEAAHLRRALRSRVVEASGAATLIVELDPARLEEQLAPLRRAIEREPQDAQFTIDERDRVGLQPSRPGIRIDPASVAYAALEAALSGARLGLLPVDEEAQPSLTTEQAKELKIERLLGTFQTQHQCCQDRVKNIHRIASMLDGKVLRPGELFSVNAEIGPRTTANGFIAAPTIVKGDMKDELGGGVSQFATTLYNAVARAGLDMVERTPHSYWFRRYPMGHEATLSYPVPDLVFRNDTEAGVLLRCEYGSTFIRVRVFGGGAPRSVDLSVGQRFDVVQNKTEYIADPTLKPEKEHVEERGEEGWSVFTTRIVHFADGHKKEEKRKVTYVPRTRRVKVHPCRIPEGEPGHTGEKCPVPEDSAGGEDKDKDEKEGGPGGEPSGPDVD